MTKQLKKSRCCVHFKHQIEKVGKKIDHVAFAVESAKCDPSTQYPPAKQYKLLTFAKWNVVKFDLFLKKK